MLAKLIVEGKEFPIEIQDPRLKELLMPKKKTGYERVSFGQKYYYNLLVPHKIEDVKDRNDDIDNESYEIANYYSDKTIAENNDRADKLMRQLRRFAVENRIEELKWDTSCYKWCIFYDYHEQKLCCHQDVENRTFGAIYFDSKSKARKAIETFHDELIWYFTEYKDSL